MILVYHNISEQVLTDYTVSVRTFIRHMEYLKAYEVVYLDQYDPGNLRHVTLTFDDAYSDFVERGVPALKDFGYPFEIFVIGNHIGKSNTYDLGVEPELKCSDLEQLKKAVRMGGRLQWHSFSHPRLSSVSDDQLNHELEVPGYLSELFPPPNFRWLAYPYGDHNTNVVNAARFRFDGAVSVFDGDDADKHQIGRIEITEDTKFFLTSYEKDTEMAKMENLLKVRDNELANLETILNSKSWRMTAPLRRLSTHVSRLKKIFGR